MTGLAAVLFTLVASAAHATIITFSDLTAAGTGYTFLGSYSSQGFTFTDPLSSNHPTDNFLSPHTDGPLYAGSTALVISRVADPAILTADLPGTFTINTIDLSALYPDGVTVLSGGPVVGPGTRDITFTGTTASLGTVTQTFTVDSFGFKKFFFDSDFTNLISLTWSQTLPPYQFDNLTLDFIPEGGVPEPGAGFTLLVAATCVGLLAFRARQRRSMVSAA